MSDTLQELSQDDLGAINRALILGRTVATECPMCGQELILGRDAPEWGFNLKLRRYIHEDCARNCSSC